MKPRTQWVHVTRALITAARPGDLSADPMAIAARLPHGAEMAVKVYGDAMYLSGAGPVLVAPLPRRARRWAAGFAGGRRVRPLRFRVRWQRP